MRERYWQLDFLRAAAITSVFLYHNLLLPADNALLSFINHVLGSLWCGVDLFFVLSGFLITTLLFDRVPGRGQYFHFLLQRALRIFPLYYFWLLIYYLSAATVLPGTDFTDLWAALLNLLTYTFNFYILQTHSWPEPGHLNHLWSLSVEEQFYFIWPVIVFVTPPKKLIYVLLAGIVVTHAVKLFMYLQHYPWQIIYTQSYTRMDAILCGALAAWIWRYKRDNAVVVMMAGLCSIISLAFVLIVIYWQRTAILSNHSAVFMTIGLSWFFASVLLLSLYVNNPKLRWLLDNKIVRTIATLSYGMYISHLIIMNLIAEVMIKSGVSNIIIEFFLNVVLTLTVSYVLYRVVETPFLRLKDAFRADGTAITDVAKG